MKVGVVGAGVISEVYLKNMTGKYKNLEVLAVADLNMENAKKRAEQFQIAACTVDEIMSNPDVEMIVNLTPVGAHYSVIRQALNAGKHVYTEKTIADTTEHAAELLALAEEQGLYLGAAPDTFMGSAIQAAKAAIDDGLLGEIHSFAISANRNNDLLTSLYPFLRKPGTGILLDYGVYYVTALASILGPVARISGFTAAPYRQRVNIMPMSPEFGQLIDTPNESQVSAIFQLKNGISGTFHIDAESNTLDEAYFAIYGKKGILYLSDPNQFGGEVKFLPNAMDPRHPAQPVTLWSCTPYGNDGDLLGARGIGPAEMAEAISENRPSRASKEMAFHVLEVLEAIHKSNETGAFVQIRSDYDVPAPLHQKPVPITNIGHITFQMKHAEEMLRFYEEALGMKKLFTLTTEDMIESARRAKGDAILPFMRKLFPEGTKLPWIQYMKLSDHQYLELFHPVGAQQYTDLGNREDFYGFKKVNYETDDIQAVYDRVSAFGAVIKEKIHPTMDGAMEFAALDPDGNEIQFTMYGENSRIPLTQDAPRETCSLLKYTTQVALQIHDTINMTNFYCKSLGLKKNFTLTWGDIAEGLEKSGAADPQTVAGLKMMGPMPAIDYIEVAPHQYLEFFHVAGPEKQEERNLSTYYGYQHFCLEVADIHAAWDAVIANGIKPDTEIALGVEGAYQFWLVDPDGNRLELMQYTKDAKQLL